MSEIEQSPDTPEEELSVGDLVEQRIQKWSDYTSRGINPYPNRFERTHQISQIIETCFQNEEPVVNKVQTAGRITGKRQMGKAGFINIKDSTGTIQIYSNNKLLNDEQYHIFQHLDIGDIIGVDGETFRTKTGEPSLRVSSLELLSKNIFPLPVVKEKDGKKFDAFSDVESRYRRRYVDLLVNDHVKETFQLRSKIISSIRSFLTDRGFMEVETPMMHAIASGAAARPFETFHNTLNIPLFLRIAPELHLKRLIVGGFEKVFEMNRNFRNEGISIKHNPEFTMMEIYQAYADFSTMMDLTESLFVHIAEKVIGTTEIIYGPHTISLKAPWERKSYLGIIQEKTGLDFHPFLGQADPSFEEAKKMAASIGVNCDKLHTFWEVVDEIFSEKVEKGLIQPVFITEFPKAVSPLAKNIPGNPHLVERFEPYILGWEMGNAFSELNDPFEQQARFEEQLKMKEQGQEEVIEMDEDFIDALKVGMPPTGGLGIGIDRLVMLFTNSASIKDVILFPLLKNRE